MFDLILIAIFSVITFLIWIFGSFPKGSNTKVFGFFLIIPFGYFNAVIFKALLDALGTYGATLGSLLFVLGISIVIGTLIYSGGLLLLSRVIE